MTDSFYARLFAFCWENAVSQTGYMYIKLKPNANSLESYFESLKKHCQNLHKFDTYLEVLREDLKHVATFNFRSNKGISLFWVAP